jgi:hypothetical protein
MNYNIRLCDLCHAHMLNGAANGAVLTLGSSEGCDGWGLRKNDVEFSGEICPKCYAEFRMFVMAAKFWTQQREGRRMPNIIITDREVQVSEVRTDEPPPGGRETPLLR